MVQSGSHPSATGFRRQWRDTLEKNGFSLDEGRYPRSSGGEVAYVYIEKADHRKLTILFHGTGNDHLFTWQPMIEALLRAGRNVLSFDLDGHGLGSTTTLIRASFAGSARDLASFLEQKGLASYPYELVGYSLGALLVLLGVQSQALKPEKIILIALPLRVRVGLGFAWNELLSLLSPAFYQQWRAYGWRETFPAAGSFRRRSFPLRLDSAFTGSYPQMVDELLQEWPPLQLGRGLSHNCLLIFGSRDRLASVPQQKLWRQAVPHATLVEIARANHFLLPFQRQTLETITSWIK